MLLVCIYVSQYEFPRIRLLLFLSLSLSLNLTISLHTLWPVALAAARPHNSCNSATLRDLAALAALAVCVSPGRSPFRNGRHSGKKLRLATRDSRVRAADSQSRGSLRPASRQLVSGRPISQRVTSVGPTRSPINPLEPIKTIAANAKQQLALTGQSASRANQAPSRLDGSSGLPAEPEARGSCVRASVRLCVCACVRPSVRPSVSRANNDTAFIGARITSLRAASVGVHCGRAIRLTANWPQPALRPNEPNE